MPILGPMEWTFKTDLGDTWRVVYDPETDKAILSGNDVDWAETELEASKWVLGALERAWLAYILGLIGIARTRKRLDFLAPFHP